MAKVIGKRLLWFLAVLVFGLPYLAGIWMIFLIGILLGTHEPYRDGPNFGIERKF